MLPVHMANEWPQLLVQHESTAGPKVTQVRGSLVVSSLQTLRELDLYPRYIAQLPAVWHEPVLFGLASSWLPIDVVLAHYGACDAMALAPAEMDTLGEHVAARIMGSFIGTLLRSARVTVGSAPLVGLRNYDRLWDRLLLGGGCTASLTGPKDALIESRGVPMFRYGYFRIAYAALVRAAAMPFVKTCHTRILRSTDSSTTVMLSWV